MEINSAISRTMRSLPRGKIMRHPTWLIGGAGPGFVGILSNGTSRDVNNIDFEHPAPKPAPFDRIRSVASHLADSDAGGLR
jgi:hypothetical protein